jgi:hypothetical protein
MLASFRAEAVLGNDSTSRWPAWTGRALTATLTLSGSNWAELRACVDHNDGHGAGHSRMTSWHSTAQQLDRPGAARLAPLSQGCYAR